MIPALVLLSLKGFISREYLHNACVTTIFCTKRDLTASLIDSCFTGEQRADVECNSVYYFSFSLQFSKEHDNIQTRHSIHTNITVQHILYKPNRAIYGKCQRSYFRPTFTAWRFGRFGGLVARKWMQTLKCNSHSDFSDYNRIQRIIQNQHHISCACLMATCTITKYRNLYCVFPSCDPGGISQSCATKCTVILLSWSWIRRLLRHLVLNAALWSVFLTGLWVCYVSGELWKLKSYLVVAEWRIRGCASGFYLFQFYEL